MHEHDERFNKIVTTQLHMEGGKSTQLRAHKQMTWTMVGNLLEFLHCKYMYCYGKNRLCSICQKTLPAQNLSLAMYTYTVAIHKTF